MAFQQTGPGKVQNLKSGEGEVNGVLYNFDVDGVIVKPDHMKWLGAHIVPLLKAGGSVTLVARTSRAGATLTNKMLSQERLNQTVKYLKGQVVKFNYKDLVAEGELHALKLGVKDGTEIESFRAVQVAAWKKPDPPPLPPPAPPPPKAPDPIKLAKRIKRRRFVSKVESTIKGVEPGGAAHDLSEDVQFYMHPTSADTYVEIAETHVLVSVTVKRTDQNTTFTKTKEITVTYAWAKGQLQDGRFNKDTTPDNILVVELDGVPHYYSRSEGERWLTEAGALLYQGKKLKPL